MRTSISQTFNLGIAKLTVSKSGLTLSSGIPGLRASVNTAGKVGFRAGMKGLSYAKSKSLKKLLGSKK